MEVKLIKGYDGKKAGETIKLDDAKAKRLIDCGLASKRETKTK